MARFQETLSNSFGTGRIQINPDLRLVICNFMTLPARA